MIKCLGSGRFTLTNPNGKELLGHVPGKLRRCRIRLLDIVLVSFRFANSNKVDIIHRYNDQEAVEIRKIAI